MEIRLSDILEEVKKIQEEPFREDSKQAYFYTQTFLNNFLELSEKFIYQDNPELPDIAQRAIVLCRVFNYLNIRLNTEATILSIKSKLKIYDTMNDLEKLKDFKNDISSLQDKIRHIKDNCKHEYISEPVYIETLAFEFTPKRKCKVCDTILDIPITEEEKIQLLKTWYIESELTISEEEIQKKKDGFNL